MTETRIVKTYLGKGGSRRTAWAVREYTTYVMPGTDPDVTVYETRGTWATEAEALARVAR